MKSVFSTTLFFSFLIMHWCNAQQPLDSKKVKSILSAGYGFFYNDPILIYDSVKENRQSITGPIYFNLEFSHKKHFGGELSFIYYHVKWNNTGQRFIFDPPQVHIDTGILYNAAFSYSFVFKGKYHFLINRRFDPFLSVGIGLKGTTFRIDPLTPPCDEGTDCNYEFPDAVEYWFPLVLQATVGVRCRIIPHLLAYCEIGYAKTTLQIGIAGQF